MREDRKAKKGEEVARVPFTVYNREAQVIFTFAEPVDFLVMEGPDALRVAKELHKRGHRAIRTAARKKGKVVRSKTQVEREVDLMERGDE